MKLDYPSATPIINLLTPASPMWEYSADKRMQAVKVIV